MCKKWANSQDPCISKCHLLPSNLALQILGAGRMPGTDKDWGYKGEGKGKSKQIHPLGIVLGNSRENKSKVVTVKGALIKRGGGGTMKV